MVELDFREPGECLISFLGLVPELAGRGHGRWLFAETLRAAPGRRASRGSRSTPARSTIRPPCPLICAPASPPMAAPSKASPIPRLAGLLPRDSAPQIPLIEP